MKALTPGEVETLNIILRHGGKVVVSMGRKVRPNQVRTVIVDRLHERGFVQEWTGRFRAGFGAGVYISGRREFDIAVTATGCRALADSTLLNMEPS